jgi:hypothetical protein
MRIDQTSSQRFPFASVHLHAPAAKEMASTASPIQEHVQVQEWEQVARDLLSSSSLEVDLAAIPVAALGSVMENLQASES